MGIVQLYHPDTYSVIFEKSVIVNEGKDYMWFFPQNIDKKKKTCKETKKKEIWYSVCSSFKKKMFLITLDRLWVPTSMLCFAYVDFLQL